ncbi:MAG: hypothetical protein AAGC53_09615 [Actinomycetota bacterium]
MFLRLTSIQRSDRGASAIQTAVMISLIAIVAYAGLSRLGRTAGGEDIETANEALGEEYVQVRTGGESTTTATASSSAGNGAGGSSGTFGDAAEGVSQTGLGGVFGGERIDNHYWNTHWTGDQLGDWEVVSGSVDVHAEETHRFNFAAEGDYIDLNGYGPGHVKKTVDIIPNAVYNLSVDIGENPYGSKIKTLQIIYDGEIISTLDINLGRNKQETFTVKLPALPKGSAVLEFKSLTPGKGGPVIDNPTLTYVPNPNGSSA